MKSKTYLSILLVTSWLKLQCCAQFGIIKKSNDTSVSDGQSVTLSCTSSKDFEFCNWILRNGGPNEFFCNFEWKWRSGIVEKQDCHRKYMSSRVMRYIGDRGNGDTRICKIKLEKVSMEDAGSWQCELEEFILGATSGRKVSQYIQLTVTEKPKGGASVMRNKYNW